MTELEEIRVGLRQARNAIIEARRQTAPGKLGEDFERDSVAGLKAIDRAIGSPDALSEDRKED